MFVWIPWHLRPLNLGPGFPMWLLEAWFQTIPPVGLHAWILDKEEHVEIHNAFLQSLPKQLKRENFHSEHFPHSRVFLHKVRQFLVGGWRKQAEPGGSQTSPNSTGLGFYTSAHVNGWTALGQKHSPAGRQRGGGASELAHCYLLLRGLSMAGGERRGVAEDPRWRGNCRMAPVASSLARLSFQEVLWELFALSKGISWEYSYMASPHPCLPIFEAATTLIWPRYEEDKNSQFKLKDNCSLEEKLWQI